MSVTIRPTRWTIGLAVILALGIGALVYAATQFTYNSSTGTFTVDAENAEAAVALYNGATGEADPTWSSCAGDVGATDITCVMSITSLKTSGNIRYSLRVPEYTGDPALASLLTATFYRSPSATTCDPVATGWSGTGSGEVAIGSVPGFGDPAPGAQAGDRELEPGQVDWICMVVHLGAGPRPFGTALSAVLRVVSDDEGY